MERVLLMLLGLVIVASTAAAAARGPVGLLPPSEPTPRAAMELPSAAYGLDLTARRTDNLLEVVVVGAEAEEWVWLMIGQDPVGSCSGRFGDQCEAFVDAEIFRVQAGNDGVARFERHAPNWPELFYVQIGSHRGHEGSESTVSPVRRVR